MLYNDKPATTAVAGRCWPHLKQSYMTTLSISVARTSCCLQQPAGRPCRSNTEAKGGQGAAGQRLRASEEGGALLGRKGERGKPADQHTHDAGAFADASACVLLDVPQGCNPSAARPNVQGRAPPCINLGRRRKESGSGMPPLAGPPPPACLCAALACPPAPHLMVPLNSCSSARAPTHMMVQLALVWATRLIWGGGG